VWVILLEPLELGTPFKTHPIRFTVFAPPCAAIAGYISIFPGRSTTETRPVSLIHTSEHHLVGALFFGLLLF